MLSWEFIWLVTNFTFCNILYVYKTLFWGIVTHYIPYMTCNNAFNTILWYVSLRNTAWHFITNKAITQTTAHPNKTKCVGLLQLLVLRHFSLEIIQRVHNLKAFLENAKHMLSTYASNKHPLALCPQFQPSQFR